MSHVLSGIFSVLSAALLLYLVIILIRVLSTWFSTGVTPPFIGQLARITDPYLNLFRRFKFLQFKFMDLTPLAAVIILLIFINIFGAIGAARTVTFGYILAIFIELSGSAVSFLFLFFLVIAAIRFVGVLAKVSSVDRVWFMLDHMLQPLIYPIISRLSPRKVIPYGTGLVIFMALSLILWYLTTYLLFPTLAYLAMSIPF